MDANAQMSEVKSDPLIEKMVNEIFEKFKELDLKEKQTEQVVPKIVDPKENNSWSMCNILFQLVLIVLLSTFLLSAMLMHSPAADAAAPTIVNELKAADAAAPTIVQQLKRLPKVVEPIPEHVPVDVKLLMKPSIFDRTAMLVQVTQKLPVQAVVSSPFQGTLPLSAALVPVTNHVDSTVTTHVPVPVETYTQWMLFMQSMSVVKPVEKTKPIAPPPACVCPRDDAKHGNDTSSDVAVESTGAIVLNGIRDSMAMVGCAFVVVVGYTFVGVLIAGSGVATE
jgi:hypothetical protein